MPITLQPGNLASINYQIRPNPVTGSSGNYQFSSIVYYTDVNSNLVYSDTSEVLDALLVQTPASLTNNGVAPLVNRYETHWGKVGDTLSVTIQNTGEATARITASNLDVVTGSFYSQQNIEGMLIGLSLPTTLAGGANLPVQYRLTYNGSETVPGIIDSVQFQIQFDYEDINSGIDSILTTSPPTDTVVVLIPPILSFALNGLSPDFAEPNSVQSFSVDIVNSGFTAVNLDSNLTIFSSPALTASTSLNSPLVILADSTTTLVFDSIQVTAVEDFYITETQLVGNYHGETLDQMLTTGQLQIGGSVQITSLTFPGLPPLPFFDLGEDSILMHMIVRNLRTDTLLIDSLQTTLRFREADTLNDVTPLLNLRRVDDDSLLLPGEVDTFGV